MIEHLDRLVTDLTSLSSVHLDDASAGSADLAVVERPHPHGHLH